MYHFFTKSKVTSGEWGCAFAEGEPNRFESMTLITIPAALKVSSLGCEAFISMFENADQIGTMLGVERGQSLLDLTKIKRSEEQASMFTELLACELRQSRFCSTLEELRLCNVSVGNNTGPGSRAAEAHVAAGLIEAISSLVLTGSALTTIDISKTNFGPLGLTSFVAAISASTTLTEVDISQNSIGTEVAVALIEALPKSNVRTLIIGQKDRIRISVGVQST